MGLSVWELPASDENVAKVRAYLAEAWAHADAQQAHQRPRRKTTAK